MTVPVKLQLAPELSPLLQDQLCVHGFFNRHGGCSRSPYDSLNVGTSVGDDDYAVNENRKTVREYVQAGYLLCARQTHGVNVHLQREPIAGDMVVDDFDAMITDQPGVALMVQTADCQPVLLYDPEKRVVGAVHSGWRGSVRNILGKTVAAMVDSFACNPAKILAAVGPSLGPCCGEFINYKKELPSEFEAYRVGASNFDFWQISRDQLQAAGLHPENIDIIGACTKCGPDYFSYRESVSRGFGGTGRLGSVIVLR